MIFDILENASQYLVLNTGFAKSVEFLMRCDLKELATGEYEIDGDSVYAVVAKDPGRREQDGMLEIHKKYIDIQLVLAGTDKMGWKPKSLCQKPSGDYDLDKDVQFFEDEPEIWLPTKPGNFAIFFPEDAHMPLISSEILHKVVVKIAVN